MVCTEHKSISEVILFTVTHSNNYEQFTEHARLFISCEAPADVRTRLVFVKNLFAAFIYKLNT